MNAQTDIWISRTLLIAVLVGCFSPYLLWEFGTITAHRAILLYLIFICLGIFQLLEYHSDESDESSDIAGDRRDGSR